MSTTPTEVNEYYNKLWSSYESKSENVPNLRHRKILSDLKKQGLKKNSTVLEIGCGSAILTNLIAKYITSGKITGVDISEETIAYNKMKFSARANMEFLVSDMSDYINNSVFDFIVFPDVLEHIPIEIHGNIFKSIRKMCHEKTIILINIPDPNFLEYTAEYTPELLQIIDQPLHLNEFSKAIYANELFIEQVNSYSLWIDINEYQSIIVKPKIAVKNVNKKSKLAVLMKRIYYRFFSS